MTALPTQSAGKNLRGALIFPLIALVVFGVWYLTPVRSLFQSAPRVATPAAPALPTGKSTSIYTNQIRPNVLLQQPIAQIPDGPLMLRVTELEMEPGARVFEHRQLGPVVHVIMKGTINVTDTATGDAKVHPAGTAYFEEMEPLHQELNSGTQPNHILQIQLLPQSRGFDGHQQFTDRGKHNEGEVRSGPYVQVPIQRLPEGPLMFRVTELNFGPKAKTIEHTRIGPAIFYVLQGGTTVRKEPMLQIGTYGVNGYFFDAGTDPLILENKPASTMRVLMTEVLPASLGDGVSTLVAGS